MKIVSKDFEPSRQGGGFQAGRVCLIPEENEDIWHLYNLVNKGDSITYANLQSYWTTTKLWKLTVVLDYYGAI